MTTASKLLAATACAMLFVAPASVLALDSTETFPEGEMDLEFFLGLHGLKGGRHFDGLEFETSLNYGVIDRFSIYGRGQVGSDGDFDAVSGGAAFGIIGNPLDTDHFDFDLMLEFGFGDFGLALIPSVELNFDLKPDLRLWGVYIRIEQILGADMDAGGSGFQAFSAVTAGTYWTIKDGHKLLAEYDMQFANNPAAGERVVDVGRVALGYNVGIGSNVDMINEIHCDVPQSGEKPAFCFSVGFKVHAINKR